MTNASKPAIRYVAGILVSIILAVWLAFLAIVALTTPNLGYGAIALVAGAIYIGGPLALLLVGLWIFYMVRIAGEVPASIHAAMFVPTFLALSVYPLGDAIRDARYDSFRAANPVIRETHINMSGETLGLKGDPDYASGGGSLVLLPGQRERFVKVRRSLAPGEPEAEFPYDGGRLKAETKTYVYEDTSPTDAAPEPRPLIIGAFAPVEAFLDANEVQESDLVTYLYYHYPDRVEVGTAVGAFAASQETGFRQDLMGGLILISLYNYQPESIARMEVNGHTLDPGQYAVRSTAPSPAACHDIPTPVGGAVLDLSQPLTVRWQTVETPGVWQSAMVDVPNFSSLLTEDEQEMPTRVMLYLLPDGAVSAERYLELRDSSDGWSILGVRGTGVPANAVPYAACGGAYDRYNPQTVQRLGD